MGGCSRKGSGFVQHASQDTTSSEVRLEMGGAAKVGARHYTEE